MSIQLFYSNWQNLYLAQKIPLQTLALAQKPARLLVPQRFCRQFFRIPIGDPLPKNRPNWKKQLKFHMLFRA